MDGIPGYRRDQKKLNWPLNSVVCEVDGMDWAGGGLGSRTCLQEDWEERNGAQRATKQCGLWREWKLNLERDWPQSCLVLQSRYCWE
jgi:hypothetical protein